MNPSNKKEDRESYEVVHRASIQSPTNFWYDPISKIDWIEQPEKILSKDHNGVDRWFEGGKLNTAWLCLDRHVQAGRGDQIALIYDSPVTGTLEHYSYLELTRRVATIAGALRRSGVGYGDRVVIYMPMIPETVMAMLACARIGAIHSVVFGGFAPRELASRIDDATPKLILTATCGIEFDRVVRYLPMVKEATRLSSFDPDAIVVLQRHMVREVLDQSRYIDWEEWIAAVSPASAVPTDSWDPLYILYTSGTTGKPKGVVRDCGGHAVALNYSMRHIYGCEAGDVFWAASDVGWVVGHSYIVYGPLIKGCTTILYEGKPVRTPDAGAIWRVISQHSVKAFFVAPTAFRAVRKEDPECELLRHYDIACLQYLFVAGERLDPPTLRWLQDHVDVPVIDHWWQTETGWAICANMVSMGLQATRAGSVARPVPGFDLRILDDKGVELPSNRTGSVVLKPPLPPGTMYTVWGDHDRFHSSYWSQYPGYYATGDGGHHDEDGFVYIMGRVDDVMNIAGHRLSSGELEEAVASHPAIAECVVIGMQDELKGQVPIGLSVLKDGVNVSSEALEQDLVEIVRMEVGAIANFKRNCVVEQLPKTRSGKILRQVLRKVVDNEPYTVPSTIDDPQIIDKIRERLLEQGLLGKSN